MLSPVCPASNDREIGLEMRKPDTAKALCFALQNQRVRILDLRMYTYVRFRRRVTWLRAAREAGRTVWSVRDLGATTFCGQKFPKARMYTNDRTCAVQRRGRSLRADLKKRLGVVLVRMASWRLIVANRIGYEDYNNY